MLDNTGILFGNIYLRRCGILAPGCPLHRADASVTMHLMVRFSLHRWHKTDEHDIEAASERTPQQFVRLTFFRLVWIFVITSVAGLYIETLVSYPIDGVWKDRAGLVWGPFSPIYGAGCTLITLALNGLAGASNITLFLIAAISGAAFEYLAGWFWETAFGIVAWSYADQPFNIGGHTCLGMAIVWGSVGLIWMRHLLPVVIRAGDAVPKRWQRPIATAMTAFLVADAVMTVGSFNCWYQRSAGQTPTTPVQRYFAEHYGDDFMENRFQTMSLYAGLADRGNDEQESPVPTAEDGSSLDPEAPGDSASLMLGALTMPRAAAAPNRTALR